MVNGAVLLAYENAIRDTTGTGVTVTLYGSCVATFRSVQEPGGLEVDTREPVHSTH